MNRQYDTRLQHLRRQGHVDDAAEPHAGRARGSAIRLSAMAGSTEPQRRPWGGAALEQTRQPQPRHQIQRHPLVHWLMEAGVGRHTERADSKPRPTTGGNVPRQIDETLGQYQRGGFQRVQDDARIAMRSR